MHPIIISLIIALSFYGLVIGFMLDLDMLTWFDERGFLEAVHCATGIVGLIIGVLLTLKFS